MITNKFQNLAKIGAFSAFLGLSACDGSSFSAKSLSLGSGDAHSDDGEAAPNEPDTKWDDKEKGKNPGKGKSGKVNSDLGVLWPPNHKMVEVTLTPKNKDDICAVQDITSDEPDSGLDEEDLPSDFAIISDLTVELRAERSGEGDGRVYTITLACQGETESYDEVIEVLVPHDQRK
jgi:hypothetical protein